MLLLVPRLVPSLVAPTVQKKTISERTLSAMLQTLLQTLQASYPLTQLDVGEFSTVKASGMTFSIQAYEANGLGRVSVMSAKGFFGLMKMDTLIINPTLVDLPLYSYDRIYAMGNDTLIVELYDTLTPESAFSPAQLQQTKALYADLPVHPLGAHWYDSIKLPESISHKGKKNLEARFDELTFDHFKAYLESAPAQSNRAEAEISSKQEKAAYYVNGLLQNGGPSTDVFKKAMGEEKTGKLFREVLFGVK